MSNKITIEQAKQQLLEGVSSIMTREDVLHLLECIEVKSESKLTTDQINNLSADIANELVDTGMDIVNDYDLSVSGREIELDSIEFRHDSIQDMVAEIIENFINSND